MLPTQIFLSYISIISIIIILRCLTRRNTVIMDGATDCNIYLGTTCRSASPSFVNVPNFTIPSIVNGSIPTSCTHRTYV